MFITHSHIDFQIPDLQNSLAGKFDAEIQSINPNNYYQAIHYSWVHDRDKLFYLPMGKLSTMGMLSLHYPLTIHTHELRNLPYIMIENDLSLETPYGLLKNTLKVSDVNGLKVHFYISKNIGISRMEIQGGQVWELVDCNVISTQ